MSFRVRYLPEENKDEVRYYIYIKDLDLGLYPQLKLKNEIEELLNKYESTTLKGKDA
jgi:hypothetical protein